MGGKIPLGFTIVETLIVLAISGAMITVALNFVSGQQGNTEFSQGIRQIENKLQLTIGQVQSGLVFNNGNLACSQDHSGKQIQFSYVAGGVTEGTSQGCQYIGEVFQFGNDATSGNVDPGVINIYPVGSNQYLTGPMPGIFPPPVTSVTDILPCAVYEPAPPSSCGQYMQSDAYATYALPDNITLKSVLRTPSDNIQMIAFYNVLSSGNLTDCNGNQIGDNGFGSLGVTMVPFSGTSLPFGSSHDTSTTVSGSIHNSLCGLPYESNYNSKIDLCFKSGTNSQWAIISLGNANDPTSLDLTIQDSAC